MAAPTNAAKHEKSSCQPGAVHTWHFSDLVLVVGDVGWLGVKRTLFGLVPTPLLPDAVEKGHTDFVLDSIRNLFQVRISIQGSLV